MYTYNTQTHTHTKASRDLHQSLQLTFRVMQALAQNLHPAIPKVILGQAQVGQPLVDNQSRRQLLTTGLCKLTVLQPVKKHHIRGKTFPKFKLLSWQPFLRVPTCSILCCSVLYQHIFARLPETAQHLSKLNSTFGESTVWLVHVADLPAWASLLLHL